MSGKLQVSPSHRVVEATSSIPVLSLVAQEIIDDPHHSDGDTTTRVLQLIPGTYTLPEGMLRLGDTPDYVCSSLLTHEYLLFQSLHAYHPSLCSFQRVCLLLSRCACF